MPVRHKHRVGDYLMQSDESGLVMYRSDAVQIWDGTWVHKSQYETRNPQEFVKALNDPIALRHIRPGQPGTITCSTAPVYVGSTNILAPTNSPGAQGLSNDGIGEMAVGCDFVVFQD